MKILFFLLFLLINLLNGFELNLNEYLHKYNLNVKCDQILNKTKFSICYSYKEKHPILTFYELEGKWFKKHIHYSRKNLTFRPDYNIPIKYRSYSKNYSGSGFDRGHNVPNADFNWNKKYQKETFYMSNVTPQARWLNRRLWAKIEKFERYLAIKYNKDIIITGSCGNKGYLRNHVGIPKYWFKIIYIPSVNKTISFLVPNTNYHMKHAKIKRYISSVKKIKEICNF